MIDDNLDKLYTESNLVEPQRRAEAILCIFCASRCREFVTERAEATK